MVRPPDAPRMSSASVMGVFLPLVVPEDHGPSRMSKLCGLALNTNEPVLEKQCQRNAVMKQMSAQHYFLGQSEMK